MYWAVSGDTGKEFMIKIGRQSFFKRLVCRHWFLTLAVTPTSHNILNSLKTRTYQTRKEEMNSASSEQFFMSIWTFLLVRQKFRNADPQTLKPNKFRIYLGSVAMTSLDDVQNIEIHFEFVNTLLFNLISSIWHPIIDEIRTVKNENNKIWISLKHIFLWIERKKKAITFYNWKFIYFSLIYFLFLCEI